MKRNFKITLLGLAVITCLMTACNDTKPAESTGTTNTEDMVEGTDGGLDSLDLPKDTADTGN